MTQHLSIAPITVDLSRYPIQAKHNLQAWNSADELLIKHAFSLEQVPTSILILNDDFGAIACALSAHPLFNNTRFYWLSDSTVAHRALTYNLQYNQLSPQLEVISSLAALPSCKCVLMRLPKSLNYLEHQLIQLQTALTEAPSIVAAGMVKHIAKNMFSLMEKHIGKVSTSLAEKKARLLFGHYQGKRSQSPYPIQWFVSEQSWQLSDQANVFCLGKFDIGSRFLLENFPQGNFKHVIDLGCGNGLLGLAASQRYPTARIDFIDESLMAVHSAQQNLLNNYPQAQHRCHFINDNSLEQQAANSADLILCNPPFHQQNTVSVHIAEQMFGDAKRSLVTGGKLVVVANRHLPYPQLLKQFFGGYKVNASNKKFVILESTK